MNYMTAYKLVALIRLGFYSFIPVKFELKNLS